MQGRQYIKTQMNAGKHRFSCARLICVCVCPILFLLGCSSRAVTKKVIVLGIDGLDPQLLRHYIQKENLPNFVRLAKAGSFRDLGTTIPPQSPVAWSSLITGTNPGVHGIFDFIHRKPDTLAPYLSTSQTEPPRFTLRFGDWIIPLSGGRVTLLRRGKALWQVLDEHRVPATIIRMPANFPPTESKARTFAGMGTPDLLGTYGTFSFYTDDPQVPAGPVNGGRVYHVQVENSRVQANLEGPGNPFRKGEPRSMVAFTVWTDPNEPTAKIVIQGRELLMREGEWSEWIPVTFKLVPYLASISGICKFYLKQVHRPFRLYVSPVNLDPSRPALPLSTPEGYARELWKQVGYFYTQGIAEDTKALSAGLLNDAEYLQQARLVLTEQRKLFELELERFHGGLFFYYFSSLDQNTHMFWRAIDQRHPAHNVDVAAAHGGILEELYREMDIVLGQALKKAGPDATVLVVSDHGFAPYYRSFNLNNWLLENGYLAQKSAGENPSGEFLSTVDWSKTRLYGLGLNGLYLNLRGREREGIVAAGAEAETLLEEVTRRLVAVRDLANGQPVISRIYRATRVYTGASVADAPDLIIGYSRGYRAGWMTTVGGFSSQVIEDNTEPWSGDHCVDAALVPGVLLSNRKVRVDMPDLTDVAPTILAEFGIPRPEAMKGRPLF